MLYWEDNVRTPLVGSGQYECGGELVLPDFTCKNVKLISSEGSSGLVYQGVSDDYYGHSSQVAAHVIIKEYYPIDASPWISREDDELVVADASQPGVVEMWNTRLSLFKGSFDSHASIYQGTLREQVTVPRGVFEANGTAYIISDMSEGVVLSDAIKGMSANAQIKTLMRLCEVLASLHDEGFVYLDLKPSNVLVVRNVDNEEPDSFTGEVKLFDFDTIASIQALREGAAAISGSGDWSAYEQTHASSAGLVGATSDVYSVGALLFWMLVGRPPKASEVIHAHGEWQLTWDDVKVSTFQGLDRSIEPLVNAILGKTLTPDPTMRYASARALKRDLGRLSEHVAPVMGAMYDELIRHEQRMRDDLRMELSENKLSSAFKSALSDFGAFVPPLSYARLLGEIGAPQQSPSIAALKNPMQNQAIRESPFPVGRERECPWADSPLKPNPTTIDLLSNAQRDLLAIMALAPREGFLVDELMELFGAEEGFPEFNALRSAGYLTTDIAVRRCRLADCIPRQAAYDNRVSDTVIEKLDDYLLNFVIVAYEKNGEEIASSLLEVYETAYELDHRAERRALCRALCANASLQAGRSDETRQYLQEAVKLSGSASFPSERLEGIVQSLIGTCYEEGLQEYSQALEHLDEGFRLLEEPNGMYTAILFSTLGSKMRALASLRRWQEACDVVIQCLDGCNWNTGYELMRLVLGVFMLRVPYMRWAFDRNEVAARLRRSTTEVVPDGTRERFEQLQAVVLFHKTSELSSDAAEQRSEMSDIAHTIMAEEPKSCDDWNLVLYGLSELESDHEVLEAAIDAFLDNLAGQEMSDEWRDVLESCERIASSEKLSDQAIRCKSILLSSSGKAQASDSAGGAVFDIDYASALRSSEDNEASISYCKEMLQAMESGLSDSVEIQYRYLAAVEFLARGSILGDSGSFKDAVGYLDKYRKATGKDANKPFIIDDKSGISAIDQKVLLDNMHSLIYTAGTFLSFEEPLAWLAQLILEEFSGIVDSDDLELYEYIVRYYAEAEDWMEIVLIADEVMSLVTDDRYSRNLEEARHMMSDYVARNGLTMSVDDIRFAACTMKSFMAIPVAVGQAFSHVGDEAAAARAFLRAAHTMNRVIDIGPADDPMIHLLSLQGFNDIAFWVVDIAVDLPKRIDTLAGAKDYLEIATWVAVNSDAICDILWHPSQGYLFALVETAAKYVSDLLRLEAESD